jgi:hypothetical protein
MKLPNKLFSYKESIISKFPIILYELHRRDYLTVYQLYINVMGKFDSVSEFLEVLDCLFVLKKVEYDYELRRIKYVV